MRFVRLHVCAFASLLFLLVSVALLSQPFTVRFLAHAIEMEGVAINSDGAYKAQAIVVLGGGAWNGRPSASFAERLTRGAELAKLTGLPLLISGGLGTTKRLSEAEVGQLFIEKSSGIPTRWLEKDSRNTWENALYSAQILKAEGVHTVFLVTSRSHLRRAEWSFLQQGICVIPVGAAGTWQAYEGEVWSVDNLWRTQRQLHEVVGLVYYWLKHGLVLPSSASSVC